MKPRQNICLIDVSFSQINQDKCENESLINIEIDRLNWYYQSESQWFRKGLVVVQAYVWISNEQLRTIQPKIIDYYYITSFHCLPAVYRVIPNDIYY